MGQKPDNLIVVLDIGSAWTRLLVADVNEEVLRYRGHGIVESAGMRKGLVAELAPAAKSVRRASEQAERAARAYIDKCVVGVGGPNVLGLNSSGGVQLARLSPCGRPVAACQPILRRVCRHRCRQTGDESAALTGAGAQTGARHRGAG